MIDLLAEKIRKTGKRYEYVVGILDGGGHVAPHIADNLGLPYKTVKISYYDGQTLMPDAKIEEHDFDWEPNGLIVDDLIDSGATISLFKQHFGEGHVAVLFWNPMAKKYIRRPEYFVKFKPKQWIVFPWEVEGR
jgi:hypoxanthine phosphoribosyltransferase